MTGIPFYQESKDLLNFTRQHWGKFTQDRIKKQIRQAQKSRENPLLYEFLKWKYEDYPVLERCGNIYPVVVFPAPKHQRYDLNSVLVDPLMKRNGPKPESFVSRDLSFRVLKERAGIPIENRLTYTMVQLNTQDTLQLSCALGYYYDTLDTCQSLEWEILSCCDKLNMHDKDSFNRFDSQLELRKALHGKVDNPIIDGSSRSAAIGISTLVAYNDNGEIKLWLKRRSKRGVAVHSGFVHVIPSFMFQPVTMEVDKEFKIPHNIFREYLEEIFDKHEPRMGEEEVHNYFYTDPRLEYLHILLGRQEAELLFTGIAIDLLNLRPEICTILWIKTSDWFNHHSRSANNNRFKVNLEFMGGYDEQDASQWVTPVSFSHSDSEILQNEYLLPSHITPPGAAAFWLGLEQLREINRKIK